MSYDLFDQGQLRSGLTWQQYHQTLQDQAAAEVEFTPLNLHRTERILRTYRPSETITNLLDAIPTPQTWMVLTEPWCGDSAQCLPYITVLTRLNPGIDLRLVLRDDNPEIMDLFLTNGSRSIPRLVIFDPAGRVLAQWGPRPAQAQAVFTQAKNEGLEKPEILERLHLFYGRNRGAALEEELIQLLNPMVSR